MPLQEHLSGLPSAPTAGAVRATMTWSPPTRSPSVDIGGYALVRVHLGTFTPPTDGTDDELDEWAVLLADEIAERLKEMTSEEQDAGQGRVMADKSGLAEAIAQVEAAETSEDGVERDAESEDPAQDEDDA